LVILSYKLDQEIQRSSTIAALSKYYFCLLISRSENDCSLPSYFTHSAFAFAHSIAISGNDDVASFLFFPLYCFSSLSFLVLFSFRLRSQPFPFSLSSPLLFLVLFSFSPLILFFFMYCIFSLPLSHFSLFLFLLSFFKIFLFLFALLSQSLFFFFLLSFPFLSLSVDEL